MTTDTDYYCEAADSCDIGSFTKSTSEGKLKGANVCIPNDKLAC